MHAGRGFGVLSQHGQYDLVLVHSDLVGLNRAGLHGKAEPRLTQSLQPQSDCHNQRKLA